MRENQQNQSWFFEKINRIDKPLARLTKKKKKTQITKVTYESGDTTIDFTDIKRIKENTMNNCMPTSWIT